METSEIMNEEIVETVEEISKNASKNVPVIAYYGLAAVCGFVGGNLIRKYVVKPLAAKIEEKREIKKYAKAFSNNENDEDIFEED